MARWYKVRLIERPTQAGITYLPVYRQDGKRVYGDSFHDRGLAEAHRHALELWRNGAGPKPIARGMRAGLRDEWGATIERWLAVKPLRNSTKTNYRQRLTKFGRDCRVETVDQVTTDLIAEYLTAEKRQGRQLSTLALLLRALSSFYRSNPQLPSPLSRELMREWRPFRMYLRQRPQVYTEDEVDRLLFAARDKRARKGWWEAFILLMLDAGLRRAEALNLLWADVDFAGETVHVRPHTKMPNTIDWRPKGIERRSIPMTGRLRDALLTRHEVQDTPSYGTPYVFISKQRYYDLLTKPADQVERFMAAGLCGEFAKIRRRAQISEGTMHDLRHTCITRWSLNPNIRPNDIQILAGHASMETTLTVYTHVSLSEACERARMASPKLTLSSPPRKPRAEANPHDAAV